MTDELVTVDGVVADHASKAPIVRGIVGYVFDDRACPRLERYQHLVVVTDDGKRIGITASGITEIRPERTRAWREIRDEDVIVDADGKEVRFDTAKLWGVSVAPGDRVRVIGHATDHAFVPDTGSHREAPEREVVELTAIAIGVGTRAENAAKQALALYRSKRTLKRPTPATERTKMWVTLPFALASGVMSLVSAVWPIALTVGLLLHTLVAWWCSQPLVSRRDGSSHAIGGELADNYYAPWRMPRQCAWALLGFGVVSFVLVREVNDEFLALVTTLVMVMVAIPALGVEGEAYERRVLLPADPRARITLYATLVGLLIIGALPMAGYLT